MRRTHPPRAHRADASARRGGAGRAWLLTGREAVGLPKAGALARGAAAFGLVALLVTLANGGIGAPSSAVPSSGQDAERAHAAWANFSPRAPLAEALEPPARAQLDGARLSHSRGPEPRPLTHHRFTAAFFGAALFFAPAPVRSTRVALSGPLADRPRTVNCPAQGPPAAA